MYTIIIMKMCFWKRLLFMQFVCQGSAYTSEVVILWNTKSKFVQCALTSVCQPYTILF